MMKIVESFAVREEGAHPVVTRGFSPIESLASERMRKGIYEKRRVQHDDQA